MTLFTIDLAKIKGRGEFKCPRCGIKISPNDETEKAYTVLEPVMQGDLLERILLQCNKCGSQICLIGFRVQNEMK
ncbi:MAG: hypothetical protein OEY22_04595 [Candidatus Bathyarchaeota archaeon]|nr:hypothetical protein [Candidatus Bathyarchaeota archaeon]MDH5787073.1 hypothetical protein [Candidatus Bathyarchaeota archaeon]